MTQAEQAKLDAICAEAFAKLDALDMQAYHMGLITGKWCDCSWCSHRKPVLTAPGDNSPKNNKGLKPSAPVVKPVPGPIRGPGIGILPPKEECQKILKQADLADISMKIKALARA